MTSPTARNPPTVSVIIPACDVADVIGEQLDALRAQVDAPVFEIVVCDNNSTDSTSRVARELAGGLDLRVIDAAGPRSASYARNRGAEAARSEVLLFCDADDLVGDLWVSALSSPLMDRDDILTAGALHHERFNSAAVLDAYGIGPDPAGPPGGTTINRPFAGYLPTVAGGNFGIRRARYLALGGMDASYPGGSEETDFAWRAQQAGAEVISVPAAVIHYRLRSTAAAIRRQQRTQQFARVLLWTRYRDAGMTGPSIAYSLREVARSLLPSLGTKDETSTLRAHRVLGGNLGALHGILCFRMFRRRPRSADGWWAHEDEEQP